MISAGTQVRKRDGRMVAFEPDLIQRAIANAFRAEHGIGRDRPLSEELSDEVRRTTLAVVSRIPDDGTEVEAIQDMVEEQLMRDGHYRVARRYIVYREEHKKARMFRGESTRSATGITVSHSDGSRTPFESWRVRRSIEAACRGLDSVDPGKILDDTLGSLYDGISPKQIELATVLSARSFIEVEPEYNRAATRLLLGTLYREAWGRSPSEETLAAIYRENFAPYLERGVEAERLDEELLTFDLERLAGAIKPERDDTFTYLGLQTIYDRYLIQDGDVRIETPQYFWMRVAMGLALNEDDREARTIEFYEALSSLRVVSATPTLFNSGTKHPQLSSCYLTTVSDDLESIFKAVSDNAKLSKWAGGLGNDWTQVRATGSVIKGTGGESQGVIPFLKIVNDTAVAVNQCFAPETLVHTAEGLREIHDVEPGDLVLGRSGAYREVIDRMDYEQHGPMVEVDVKHSISKIRVTSGHPIRGIRGVPMEQSVGRTMRQIESGRYSPEWIEAGELKRGDYVAQTIPLEVVPVEGFSTEDARLYGIILGDGHLTKKGSEWGVSGNPSSVEMAFVRRYLTERGIHFWENRRNEKYTQVKWSSGRGVVRDAATGRISGAGEPTLPFAREDVYDDENRKRISRRFSHLVPDRTLALIRGLIESDGCISRGKEIYFTNTSRDLAEGIRYQLLRLGIPSAGQCRTRVQDHTGTRVDGTTLTMAGTCTAYDVRIPAVPELAELVGCNPIHKRNWLRVGGEIFSRVKSVKDIEPTETVHDLAVEADESYMTTAALVHNGGKRKGAACSYLETWHLDIEDFLELRKNTGDERRRTHDMNTANWVPDLFVKRVIEGGEWTLFSPNEVEDLHDLTGLAFERRYEEYERKADAGEMRQYRRVEAGMLWKKMLSMLFETGHPWITFKDPSNLRSPQDHAGVVHSSNLCCIAGDQRVVTGEGILTVEELYERDSPNTVVGRTGAVPAGPMLLPRPDAPMVKVVTHEGYTHKVTPDHKLWVVDRGWVEAQDLVKGDLLEIQQVEGLWGAQEMEDEAFLCGLIAGDGTFGRNEKFSQAHIDIWANDFDLIPEVEERVARILSNPDYEVRYATTATPEPKFSGGEFRRRLTSTPLARILASFGFQRESKFRVPEFVWRGTRETVCQYLRGLYLTDATVQAQDLGVTTCSLASHRKEFLEEIQILLANLGVKSSLRKMRDAGPAMLPDGEGGEREFIQSELWRLMTTSIRGCQILEKATGVGQARNNARYLSNLEKNGYRQKLWATFEGLEILPNEDAYCLQVFTDEHSWTVNGMISKNTEILLNTSAEETAVCNLASLNLAAHTDAYGLDEAELSRTIKTAVRMLDNVIDINFYPTPEAKTANDRHRPVGLGLMGFQDALFEQRISYASEEAVRFSDYSMEMISYHAILASKELAKERGTYRSYDGSKWSRGLLPIDTIDLLEAERGVAVEMDRTTTLDWEPVRQAVAEHGMRNSNVMAIAPTATISNISGVYQSIEPTYSNLFVKSNLSGEFTIANNHLVRDLKKRGLWDGEMLDDLKHFDGSVQEIDRVPEDLKKLYLTAFEIDSGWIIDCASRRQKWLDMGQSLNLYLAQPSGRVLSEMYLNAWRKGLKTTYYLRSRGATNVEKSSTDINRRGIQPRWMKSQSASSRIEESPQKGQISEAATPASNPEPESNGFSLPQMQGPTCSPDEPDCEACQ